MYKFAERMNEVTASDVREILKITARPEIISFAGGLPAPELFPVEAIRKATNDVLDEAGRVALQYGPTEGYLPLRKQICQRLKEKNSIDCGPEKVLITAGSQQGLDFVARLFVNPGDVILMESPSYLGAISAFKVSQPNFVEVPTDEFGMDMDALENILATTDRVKMIYVIPDFQNPSGRTWPMERRVRFMEIINKYEVPVIEDNPYGELRFKGEFLPSLKSMDSKGLVVYLGTFSKILAPGYRLGWIVADGDIMEKLVLLTQAAVLQTSTISMMIVSKFLEQNDLDAHVEKIREVYKHRCDLMLKTMDEYFPKEAKYTYPDGGLFTWVELPEHIDTKVLASKALDKLVAYVPGIGFFPNGDTHNCMRLNYSNMPDERIVEGIKRLAEVLKEAIG